MAKTYYNYAEREADSYVNWGEIGKNLSDMLQEQNKIREDKKAAIDKASREFGEVLSNAPQGEQKQLNQWALEYAADAQEARLLQDRLLKSGRLKVRDYTVMRQNINDGTKQLFKAVKTFQEGFKEKMERAKTDKSQDFELWAWNQAQNFGDFTKNKAYINPTNYQVNIARTKKEIVDGKEVYVMDNDPNKFKSINSLLGLMSQNYDKYDVPGNVKAMVDNLGVEINSIERLGTLYNTGSITETLDITKRKNLPADAQGIIMKFEEAETKMLESQLTNQFNTSSILTNSIKFAPNGKQYTFEEDEKKIPGNPHLILAKVDLSGVTTFEFTPEQEKAALERLRLEARMQYDKKQEIKATPQAQLQERRAETQAEIEQKNLEAQARNFAENMSMFLTGTPSQVKNAKAYLESLGVPLDRKKSGVDVQVFERDRSGNIIDSKIVPYEFGSNTADDMAKTLIGGLNALNLPEEMVMKYVRQFNAGKKLNLETAIGRIETPVEETPIKSFQRHIDNSITNEDVKGKNKTQIADDLNRKLVGLKVTVDYPILGEGVYITNDDGVKSPTFSTNVKPEMLVNNIREWIKKNPSGKELKDKEDNIRAMQKAGLIPQSTAAAGTGELD